MLLYTPAHAATVLDEIPAAVGPAEANRLTSSLLLQLEIVINGVPSGVIVPVWDNHGQFSITAGDLRALALPVDGEPALRVALDQLPGVTVSYDAPNQRLNIQVPAEWLQHQTVGRDTHRRRVPAQSSAGFLLNYDLYAADTSHSDLAASLWTDWRAFGPMGVISSTGVLRYDGGGTAYTRYDTRWTRSDEDSMTTYEAGDIITRALPWSSAIRLGGFQISRDFSVRPDVVTYPVPTFAGEAALPSGIELFIDSHQTFGGKVQPGPFTLAQLPQINGAGQASIVVTDALGRQVTTTIPFYVASTLLRPGLTDYAVAGGALRQRYGQRNFDYGRIAASASIRHGLTDRLTVEGHTEASENLIAAGVGAVFRLGMLGVFNASYTRSQHAGDSGGQITLGYQYQRHNFSFAVTHTRQDAGFFDLAALDRESRGEEQRHYAAYMTSVSASVALGRFGSLGAGYFDTRWRSDERTRLINASWSLPLGQSINLYTSATYDVGKRNWTGSLNVLIPLGRNRGTLSSNVVREQDGRYSSRIDYNRAVPSQGGLGWRASLARLGNGDIYADGNVTWRTRDIELRAGAYGSKGSVTRWFGATGSFVWMDDALFTANRVADAFALVDTGGQSGVPVYYENQLVGRSNANGHVLVPWATAYYPAKYAVDPLELADDVITDTVAQNVAIRRGSGSVINFPIHRMIAAKMTAVGGDNTPLPVGSVVRINGTLTTYVGWDGLIFADNLLPSNDMAVTLPDGVICRATFAIDINAGGIADLGTVPCQ